MLIFKDRRNITLTEWNLLFKNAIFVSGILHFSALASQFIPKLHIFQQQIQSDTVSVAINYLHTSIFVYVTISGPFFFKYSQTYIPDKYELFEVMSCMISQNDPQFVKQQQQNKVKQMWRGTI